MDDAKAATSAPKTTLTPAPAIDDELKALRHEIRRVASLHQPQVDPVDQALRTFGRSFERGLEETRDLLRALLSETRAQTEMGFEPAQAKLYTLLTHNGVEDLSPRSWCVGSMLPRAARRSRRQLAERLLGRVRTPCRWRHAEATGRRVPGPTGVGKTTTIAKIAADASIRYGRKVG